VVSVVLDASGQMGFVCRVDRYLVATIQDVGTFTKSLSASFATFTPAVIPRGGRLFIAIFLRSNYNGEDDLVLGGKEEPDSRQDGDRGLQVRFTCVDPWHKSLV
jgi:hypothetical protein